MNWLPVIIPAKKKCDLPNILYLVFNKMLFQYFFPKVRTFQEQQHIALKIVKALMLLFNYVSTYPAP